MYHITFCESFELYIVERPNLLERELVKDLRASLMNSLKEYLSISRPNDTERSEKVTAFLANVHDIGKQHSLLMNVYRADVGKLNVTPVITELFDLHPPSSYKEAWRIDITGTCGYYNGIHLHVSCMRFIAYCLDEIKIVTNINSVTHHILVCCWIFTTLYVSVTYTVVSGSLFGSCVLVVRH